MSLPTDLPGDRIEHRETGARGEFFIERGGNRVAELTYSVVQKDAVVGHTWVDPKHRGGTLAPSLVAALVDWARREDRKVVPVCSYVRSVFGRNAQYADVWKK